MWCPLCTAEYQPGYTRCTSCRVDLVDEKPDHAVGWYDGRGISALEACSFQESSEQVFASIHRVLDELGWQITAESQPYCALNAAACGRTTGSAMRSVSLTLTSRLTWEYSTTLMEAAPSPSPYMRAFWKVQRPQSEPSCVGSSMRSIGLD